MKFSVGYCKSIEAHTDQRNKIVKAFGLLALTACKMGSPGVGGEFR